MTALSTLQTYIRRDFKRTDKNTEIIQAINDSILWISTLIPHGDYKYQSWVYTALAREDYALPSNLIHLIHPIKFLEGSASADSGFPLEHITKEEYDIREPNPNRTSPSTGRPSAYTVFSRSILVTPLPDKTTYLLEIMWSRRPGSLSAAADTPELGSEWDEVIKHISMDKLYAGMGMLQESGYWASLYRDAEWNPIGLLRNLINAERDREFPAVGQVKFNQL